MLRPTLLYAFVFVLAAGPGLARSADAAPPANVTVAVEPDHPLNLPAITAGRIEGPAADLDVVELPSLAERSGETTYAQTSRLDGRTWFAFEPNSADVAARSISLPTGRAKPPARVTIMQDGGGFLFKDDGRKVLYYQQSPKSLEGKSRRANYVHPLWNLDGDVLTQDFPADHIHHRGVFWAWHQVDAGGKRIGDGWVNKDFLAVVKTAETVEEGPVFATLRIVAHWTSPNLRDAEGRPEPFVEETTLIRVFRRVNDAQYVDFKITLNPLQPDVRIGGSEDDKGYSGFTVRVKPPREMQIADASGVLKADGMHNKSAWADVSGRFGPADENNRRNMSVSGVAILSHPTLPEFPPRWLLRRYGMQNVLWPGREAVALPGFKRRTNAARTNDAPHDDSGKLITLRHRLVLHKGDFKAARIADHQRIYESAD